MIIMHEGVPGSGKSYDAVRKIIEALKRGRVVYTNIDGMNQDTCLEYLAQLLGETRDWLSEHLFFLTNDQVRSFWLYVQEGAFIVLDEVQLFFNSRDFAKESNREFGNWASTHRHHGYDLLLITQRAARIDTSVRSLCEFRYRYRKLNVFGSLVKKGYLIYTFAGEDVEHLSIRKATYDSKIFPAYNSYVGDATEKKVTKNPNLFNHPIFYLMAACFIGVLYFLPKSHLLSGDLSAIASGGHVKMGIVQGKGKQPGKAPAIAGPGPAAPSSSAGSLPGSTSSASSGTRAVRVQAYVQAGKQYTLLVNGLIVKRFLRFSPETMTVFFRPGEGPQG